MGFIRQSFKRQIFFIFLAVTLAMVIIGGILTVQGFQASIKADYQKNDIEQDRVLTQSLVSDLEMVSNAANSIAENEILLSAVAGEKGVSSLSVYSALYENTRDIKDFATVELYTGGKCIFSTKSGYSSNYLPESYSVLKEAVKKQPQIVYGLDPATSSETGAALLIARMMVDEPQKGYVVIRIEQNDIVERISGNINSRDGFMLTNEFLRPYCLLGIAEDGKALSTIRNNLMKGALYNAGVESNVYIEEIGSTGLLGIYLTPPALDDSAVRVGYQIIVIQALISIIVCLAVASRMSSYFSKPIRQMAQAMKRFRKGDFETRIELEREDEFEQLATGFNKMTSQLNQTMEERVAAEHKVNETRIQMMQAQLNPHFLYNTLDTIKWVAKANQVPEVATLSASLASILRTSISEKQFCKLEQEIKLVESYCDIQKIRFDDSFDLTVNLPENLENAIIPKLILQPIVENAIIHGLDGRTDGHIWITARGWGESAFLEDRSGLGKKKDHDIGSETGPDLLEITIKDNGAGISEEVVEALANDDPDTLEGHLGLNNVNTIIRLYYGKEYGVSARKAEEGGTVMKVLLPLSYKEPVDNGDLKA
ncbi:MAG: sensor histidine kinase [Butyrivibrio sp.]|nr:sensor histidine kinase [Butyrivibrio sp.]